jgi:hypothetical protein
MTTTPHIRCCFCGRVTLNPAAYIGTRPVGPTCARKHAVTSAVLKRKGHAVRFVPGRGKPAHASTAKRDAKTRDLFEGQA